MFYVIKYTGSFGFIKPWTAVRDSLTFSQQFLTPSIVEGIEKKLFPELLNETGIKKIKAHRLSYSQISEQQEVTQTRGWNSTKKGKQYLFERPSSILTRGVLIDPILYLAFDNLGDAEIALKQHICLCRNEDVLLPENMEEINKIDFSDEERFPGFELIFERNEKSFQVGFDRGTGLPMYGWLNIIGTPIKSF